MATKFFDVMNPSVDIDFQELMERNYKNAKSPYRLNPRTEIYDINDTAVIFDNAQAGGAEIVIMIGADELLTSTASELERKLNVKLEERE